MYSVTFGSLQFWYLISSQTNLALCEQLCIWMTICLTCFLLLETKSGERQKEWWGLCECSRGSCSFFAWLAFREASYLADDKCLCTLSCLRTPADFKPWQPAQPQPHNLRPSTSACPSAQQINDNLYSLWPVDTSATAAYPISLLSDMGGNAHVHWQVRPPWQCDVLGTITEATCVAER